MGETYIDLRYTTLQPNTNTHNEWDICTYMYTELDVCPLSIY